MQRYRPSGAFTSEGVAYAVAASVGVGLIAGALIGAVGQWFRLLLVFEILMGLAAGAAASLMIKRYAIRAPWVAVVVGVVGGAGAIVGDEAVGYQFARQGVRESLSTFAAQYNLPVDDDGMATAVDAIFAYAPEETTDAQIAATIQGAPLTLEDGTAVDPLAAPSLDALVEGWLKSQVDAGMTIGRVGQKGDQVGSTGTLVWMVLGFLCVLGMAGFLAHSQARAPYDEEAKAWFPDGGQRVFLGLAAGKKPFVAALEAGDIRGAVAALVTEGKAKKGLLFADLSSVTGHGAWLVHVGLVVSDKQQRHLAAFVARKAEVDQLLGEVDKRFGPPADEAPAA